jgi:hypothetical protein
MSSLVSAPGGSRTPDQVLRRHLLYPLSYGRSIAIPLCGTGRSQTGLASPSTISAPGQPASVGPGSASFERRTPLPITA